MLTVGKLAKECDVRTDTVRYYERVGLIAEADRTSSGYRNFAPSVIDQIRFIKSAQALGFSLDEIKKLMALADPASSSDCSEVCRLAEAKITELDQQIRQMRTLQRELESLVAECPGTTTEHCNILATINSKLKRQR